MMHISFRDWLATTLRDGQELSDDTVNVVSEFTLIWGLFEGTECGAGVDVPQLDRFVRRILGSVSDQEVNELLEFWMDRYIIAEELNGLFQNLNFRQHERQELVSAVLLRNDESLYSKLLALMLVTYRLRNNLFHGLKVITLLNEQKENLSHATRVLQTLMPHSGRYIYLDVA